MRLVTAMVLVASVLLPIAASPSPASATDCQFVLGFRTLHDLIPNTVGDCKTNEYHNPQNGDGLQQTTGGLLVWRKADNWTAFTDGYRTWINGPNGLQQRLNTERFPWEKDPVISIPTVACSSNAQSVVKGRDVDIVRYQLLRAPWGVTVMLLSVRNNCNETRRIEIRARAYSGDYAPPTSLGNVFTHDYAPYEEYGYLYGWANPDGTYPNIQPWYAVTFHWNWAKLGSTDLHCINVGGDRCLLADPWLRSSIEDLARQPAGQQLLAAAAQFGVSVRRGELSFGVLGSYRRDTKTVTVRRDLDAYSEFERAAVIAHELQHATDHAAGLTRDGRDNCYTSEERAFRTQATVWSGLWKGLLPRPANSMQSLLNATAIAIRSDPLWLTQSLLLNYGDVCE